MNDMNCDAVHAQNKDINTTHRRKQLCYVTSCEANGRVGLDLISSLTPVINMQVNKKI